MTPATPHVKPWPHNQPLSAAAVEGCMKAEGVAYYRWSNRPGDIYPAHEHPYHKVIYVVRGDISFGLPHSGERINLGAGDRLELPAGVVHNATVGEQGVVCLEGHRRAE